MYSTQTKIGVDQIDWGPIGISWNYLRNPADSSKIIQFISKSFNCKGIQLNESHDVDRNPNANKQVINRFHSVVKLNANLNQIRCNSTKNQLNLFEFDETQSNATQVIVPSKIVQSFTNNNGRLLCPGFLFLFLWIFTFLLSVFQPHPSVRLSSRRGIWGPISLLRQK